MTMACDAIPKATTERSWNPWEQKPGMKADLQDTSFIMADDLGWKTKTSGFAGSWMRGDERHRGASGSHVIPVLKMTTCRRLPAVVSQRWSPRLLSKWQRKTLQSVLWELASHLLLPLRVTREQNQTFKNKRIICYLNTYQVVQCIRLPLATKSLHWRDIGTPIFTAALFTIAMTWKQTVIESGMDKENVVCIPKHNEILLSHEKEGKLWGHLS